MRQSFPPLGSTPVLEFSLAPGSRVFYWTGTRAGWQPAAVMYSTATELILNDGYETKVRVDDLSNVRVMT